MEVARHTISARANRQDPNDLCVGNFASQRHGTRSLAFLVAGASAFSLALIGADAATTDSTIGVTSTVQATCLNTATPLAFGTYAGVVATATAVVTITCTNTTPYNVGLDAGLATGATVLTRQMTGPAGAFLGYTLSSDAAHSINWGVTVGTDTVAGVATGAAQPITVYGQEAAGQFVAPGAYTDTITATVTY